MYIHVNAFAYVKSNSFSIEASRYPAAILYDYIMSWHAMIVFTDRARAYITYM